jgi:hypothetical protein
MSREHQMLTWHTLAADLEAKQKLLADTDKSKVSHMHVAATTPESWCSDHACAQILAQSQMMCCAKQTRLAA